MTERSFAPEVPEEDAPIEPGPSLRWGGDGALARARAPRWGSDDAALAGVEVTPAGVRIPPDAPVRPVASRPEPTVDGMRLAPVFRRAGGWFVDYLIKSLLLVVILTIAGIESAAADLFDPRLVVPALLFQQGYDFLFMATGATPGMRIMRIRVVRLESGADPGFRRSLFRAGFVGLVYVLIVIVATFVQRAGENITALHGFAGLGVQALLIVMYLSAIWDRRRQTLQDRVAGTIVIHAPVGERPRP